MKQSTVVRTVQYLHNYVRTASVTVKGNATPKAHQRSYHDESFGYRRRQELVLSDYTSSQLQNRATNAPLLRYVDSMRTHGHRAAHIDPLDLLQREEVAALDPSRYGLENPKQTFPVDGIVWTNPAGPNMPSSEVWPLERIVSHLRSVYVGNIAYEFMHSPSKTERLWFSHILESSAVAPQNVRRPEEKKRIWELMTRSEVFDQFLQVKFPNLKRYGLEGGESMLPAIDTLFSVASKAGVEHIVLAMPHRGRLNLLTDLLRSTPAALFHKIKGGSEVPEDLGYSGDVISHLVAAPTLSYGNTARSLKVSLLPNPSHLEAVDPVALGKTRAKQFALIKEADPDCKLGDKVMCVQLHGDASFIGQGVVMESLGLSNLPHFTSGGSVHLVVNYSIGYTTPASSARSSLYCSDVGKMINAPVLHVNGDHPEDVSRALDTAFQYRNAFRKDIIVDLLVYRRWGHNELDEPAFTQPAMYQNIRTRKSVPALYEDKLTHEEVISSEDISQLRSSYKAHLESELQAAESFKPALNTLGGKWKQMVLPVSPEAIRDPETGVALETLKDVARASVEAPEGFEIHPRLKRHSSARLKSIEAETGIDWATAEAMAFGSLMLEGYDVRISGQDVGRGTFSQRHAMLVDQRTENVSVPLNARLNSEGRLELANSSLSEMAVLGFEYGMSWETPKLLPIWEAQFGDFFNGAQVIFDTFISSAETKWLMQSGIVVLLPHGLDGAGPEHSSMRIERMLQLTNDPSEYNEGDGAKRINMQVVYPTTPAQYFHLLRRQMKRNYRRPLIVASPKGLLRLPAAASSLVQFEPNTRFQPVLDDSAVNDLAAVKRVVLLSGKLYYDLVKERNTLGSEDANKIALIRVEELAPFPYKELEIILRHYRNAREWCWVQEEPRNQGAWSHVFSRLLEVQTKVGCEARGIRYIGRKEDVVPAVGVGKLFREQQSAVLRDAFAGL
ncbi:dehydrogenase E1 and transketolase domain-containing protein 1 [Fomitiporia mediterranea MF3/22]|uniref:dehydrogenase E1 and transketolase domain-containing protein 1 n=1 Tax=Fomitiporia mediterranea (strain MF3/22) TaxID=694068 RepID=UPI0004408B84|nr:dehydrogenase E1 and transketolase domain-containing protein 1 [Fomitiporia mediterranea MF3/22]EJC99190.1 dehydrogenase E1 and transketolase domain-containing protein 1 [Fomitiporia mediterranea MF3/22]